MWKGVAAALALLLSQGLAAAALASDREPRVIWQRAALEASGEAARAVALDARGERVAIGGERGVLLGRPGASLERALRRGPVLDLAFLPDAAVLVATAANVYRIGRDGGAERVRIGTGEAAHAVSRIAVGGNLIAVASGSGVHLSRDARVWHRPSPLPRGAAGWVAVRARGASLEVWTWISGQLWTLRVDPTAPLVEAAVAQRVALPLTPRDGGVVDAVFDVPGADTLLLLPSAMLLRASAADGWRVLRPSLPPGAAALRIAHALGCYWLATDTGLVRADTLTGPWQRAAAPAGRLPVLDLAGDGSSLHVAGRQGVLRAVLAEPEAAPPAPPATLGAGDPPITEVHRAALAYLALEPSRMRALRRGAARRGWLPILSVRLGHDRDTVQRREYDESFLSGATRNLFDESRDQARDLAVDLTLSWDLGDAAFHPEEIDVSRESRAVIELRDDVLDEVTQLYFERRRTLGQLAALDPEGADALPLRHRAAELSAGLDAWTGGWFSRRAAAP
ncbi:MAG: hypothetical protein OEY15_09830 [Myxococcales bacterium]|nr:hypothetical protein [Myxococcales bacterium]